jgi:hypothetical protein
MKKLEEVWARLPAEVHCDFRPITTEIGESEATTVAAIAWQHRDKMKEIKVHFRLQPGPSYYGWDIIQTSLLDVLLTEV